MTVIENLFADNGDNESSHQVCKFMSNTTIPNVEQYLHTLPEPLPRY